MDKKDTKPVTVWLNSKTINTAVSEDYFGYRRCWADKLQMLQISGGVQEFLFSDSQESCLQLLHMDQISRHTGTTWLQMDGQVSKSISCSRSHYGSSQW